MLTEITNIHEDKDKNNQTENNTDTNVGSSNRSKNAPGLDLPYSVLGTHKPRQP